LTLPATGDKEENDPGFFKTKHGSIAETHLLAGINVLRGNLTQWNLVLF